MLLETFVCVVDTQLLQTVDSETLEAVDIEDSYDQQRHGHVTHINSISAQDDFKFAVRDVHLIWGN